MRNKLLAITNNPERASFRQRVGVYVDLLRSNGIDCEIATLPDGFVARRRLFKRFRSRLNLPVNYVADDRCNRRFINVD